MPTTPSALEIARALIRCASVTPKDEGALAYLSDLLAAHDFVSDIVRFQSPGGPPIYNLYARFGRKAPHLMFAGHTDVVPPGDVSAWRFDPFSAEVAEGRLWGRGAVDMKGGLAASIAAALERIAAAPPAGSISFLITGDEEGPAIDGTVKLLAWARERGEVFDHCLLAEPTSVEDLGDVVKIGRRGSLTGRLTISGRQGHVAYPHLADNPVRKLPGVLEALMGRPLDAGTASFDASNLEIVTIDVGNPATNVIPAGVKLAFNVRFNDLWTAETLAAELRGRVERALGDGHTLTFDPSNAPSFLTKPGPFTALVSRAVRETTGREPRFSTGGGTSDARFIKSACPVVELGLVGKSMHAVDENTPVDELEALSRVFRRAIDLYFENPPG